MDDQKATRRNAADTHRRYHQNMTSIRSRTIQGMNAGRIVWSAEPEPPRDNHAGDGQDGGRATQVQALTDTVFLRDHLFR